MSFRTSPRRGYSFFIDREQSYQSYINSLLVHSPLALWDAGSGVYEDVSLTDTVENDDLVAGWADLSGNGHHVTQSTSGDRPVFRSSVASLNNRPAIEFVSSDYLFRTVSSGILSNLNVYNAHIVYRMTSTDAGVLYGETNTASGSAQQAFARLNLTNSGRQEWSHVDDASVQARPNTITGIGANNGNARLFTIRRIASNNWSLRLDGAQTATANTTPTTTTINRITIGSFLAVINQNFFVGHIATIFLSSSDNYQTIEPILKRHYGIA